MAADLGQGDIVGPGADRVGDDAHGTHNVATLNEWAERWVPVSLAAARQLQPLWSQPAERVIRFEDSLDRAKERLRGVLSDLRLNEPKELQS